MNFRKILVRMSSLAKAIPNQCHLKATYWSAFSLGFSFLILASCASTKHVETVAVETLRHDTVYLHNLQYDSIYIYNNVYQDRSKDTLFIREVNTEYRYRLLRDTIYKTRIDSIPYEVSTTITKEVCKPPNLFDYICYLSFGALMVLFLVKLSRLSKILV